MEASGVQQNPIQGEEAGNQNGESIQTIQHYQCFFYVPTVVPHPTVDTKSDEQADL